MKLKRFEPARPLPGSVLRRFVGSRQASMAVYMTLSLVPLLAAIGLAVDYATALRVKTDMQALLDGAVLAGAAKGDDPVTGAATYFALTTEAAFGTTAAAALATKTTFTFEDQTVKGIARMSYPRLFGIIPGESDYTIAIAAEAVVREAEAGGPCINVLANTGQALLLNSGAQMDAKDCEIHVHSTQDPAFIMNAGVDLDISRLCVKGTRYIKNGGTVTKLETGCAVAADPYAGVIPEPTLPGACTTSGARDGQTHTLNPGMHCSVNFNGNPKITFKPGLHIIKGPMNINSGSTVIADGVTFYFPDTDSKIQANGALTMTATAPASGDYKNILMFEKTSNASNNANKRQYVFNGSNGEVLQGVIYLPNRDVTYNSTTNVSGSKISMVVNTMIVNSANWTYEGFGSSGDETSFYLSK